MVSFTFPGDGDWQPLSLQPSDRRVLGVASKEAALDPLQNRVSVQRPQLLQLTVDAVTDDSELRLYIENESSMNTYYLVRTGCSFQPEEGEPFSGAAFKVQLRRADNLEEPIPVAYSMQPLKLTNEVKFSRTVTMKGDLKLFDTGLEAGGEEETTRTKEEPLITAFNEGQADPAWEFRRQPGRDIFGVYHLTLVVRAPAGVAIVGSVRLSVVVEKKRLGLFTFNASHNDVSSLEFRLGG